MACRFDREMVSRPYWKFATETTEQIRRHFLLDQSEVSGRRAQVEEEDSTVTEGGGEDNMVRQWCVL